MVGTGKFEVFTTSVSPRFRGWLSLPSKFTLASALAVGREGIMSVVGYDCIRLDLREVTCDVDAQH